MIIGFIFAFLVSLIIGASIAIPGIDAFREEKTAFRFIVMIFRVLFGGGLVIVVIVAAIGLWREESARESKRNKHNKNTPSYKSDGTSDWNLSLSQPEASPRRMARPSPRPA